MLFARAAALSGSNGPASRWSMHYEHRTECGCVKKARKFVSKMRAYFLHDRHAIAMNVN